MPDDASALSALVLSEGARPQTLGIPVAAGSPFPRGATWDGNGVNFWLFSGHVEAVEVCMFDRDGRRELPAQS
jgi:pullulanase/glycogen debranching enzyme